MDNAAAGRLERDQRRGRRHGAPVHDKRNRKRINTEGIRAAAHHDTLDNPGSTNAEQSDWLDSLPVRGGDRSKISRLNALELLGLNAPGAKMMAISGGRSQIAR